MVDFGIEDHLWRRHGVVIWQEKLCLELSSLIARSRRACYMRECTLQFDEEVLIISRIRTKCDAWHWVGLNSLGLFHYTRTRSLHFVDKKRLFDY